MQSLLVDINTAAITYRRECLQSLEKKMYATCLGCIKAMNGLLPKDEEGKSYRIRWDSNEFNEKIRGITKARCYNCNADTERSKLNVFEVRLASILASVTNSTMEKVWICNHCKKENILTNTLIIKNVIPQPFYSQVLPDPPQRKDGLVDQIEYEKRVIEWVWMCLDNLEESFTRYRKDYKPKSWEVVGEVDNSLDDLTE